MTKKKTIIIGIIVAAALLLYIYLPGYTKYRDLRKRRENLAEQIAALEAENAKLAEEIELLKNDLTYMEKILRDEMGMIKPGEIVFKLEDE